MPIKLSSEYRLDTLGGTITNPALTSLHDNRYLALWANSGTIIDGANYGIAARIVNATGDFAGPEFQVNTYVTSQQTYPSAAVLSSGNFIVSWRSDTADGSGAAIAAQLFNSDGNRINSEFIVNTVTVIDQILPSVAALNNGGFIITWASSGQEWASYNIYGQFYDSTATRVGGEFLINTYTAISQTEPSITCLKNGNIAIAWQSFGQDGSSNGIYCQLLSETGTPIGSEFQVNTYTTLAQDVPKIAALTNGNFAIAWNSFDQDGSNYGVYGQVFDSLGNPIGSEFRANTYVTNDQRYCAISSLDGGDFIVTWASNGQDGSGYGIYGQLFNQDGMLIGDEFLINTITSGTQLSSASIKLTDGSFVVMWENNFSQAKAQRFSPLSLTNETSTVLISYDEDTTKGLGLPKILSAAKHEANVSLTLSDPTAGELASISGTAIVPSFDNSAGIWSASGNITQLNTLLKSLKFIPYPDLSKNVSVAMNVSDKTGAVISQLYNLMGAAVNDAPSVINPVKDIVIETGRPFNITLLNNTFSDRDHALSDLSLSLRQKDSSALPAGMIFYPEHGRLAGILESKGSWSLSLIARDPEFASASTNFTLNAIEPKSTKPLSRDIIIGASVGAVAGLLLLFCCWVMYRCCRPKPHQTAKPAATVATAIAQSPEAYKQADNFSGENPMRV